MANFDATYSGHPFTLRLNVSVASQSVPGNYSTLSWNLQTIKTGAFTPFVNDGSATWAFNGGGSGSWSPYNFNGGIGQTITMASGSYNVAHAGDGTGSASFTFSADGKATITTASGSGSMALPTIARSPGAPTVGTLTQTDTTSATLTWTAPSSDGGSAVDGYTIQYATNSSFTGATTLSVGNVTSYGLTSLTPGTQIFAHVAASTPATRAGASAPYSASASVVMVATVGDLDGWTTYGTLPGGLTPVAGTGLRRGSIYVLGSLAPVGLLREIQQTGTGSTVSAGSLGIQRTMTGLTIGSTYKLDATVVSLQDTPPTANIYRWGVVGIGIGSNVTTSDTSHTFAVPSYSFVATATSHTIQLQNGDGTGWSGSGWWEAIGMYGMTMTEIPNTSPRRLQDVAYAGPLNTHFQYACDTVGAAWWVGKDNVTRFRQSASDSSTLKATFTDKRATGKFEYVDISASYDTKNVVNTITVNNHGRDAATGNTRDVTYTASDATSVGAYGVRSGSLDMEMRSGYIEKVNLIRDPSMEGGAGTYTPTQSTLSLDTSWAAVGTNSLLITASGADSFADVDGGVGALRLGLTPGKTYVFSGTGNVKVAATGTNSTNVAPRSLVFYSKIGSGAYVPVVSSSVPNTVNTPTRVSVEFTVPIGATEALIRCYFGNSAGSIRWDALTLFEKDTTAGADNTSYFDGYSTDSTGNLVYAWTGTPNASTSTRTTFALLNSRIAEVVTASKNPARKITSIRWNAQENTALASSLEVQDRIRVEFGTTVQDSRIVGIKHDLNGDSWIVGLEIVPG